MTKPNGKSDALPPISLVLENTPQEAMERLFWMKHSLLEKIMIQI